jgi:hypothetical protein
MIFNFFLEKFQLYWNYWISVIPVFVSATWTKFSLKSHQKISNFKKYFEFYFNSCALLKELKYFNQKAFILMSTEITEIQWNTMRFHWKWFPCSRLGVFLVYHFFWNKRSSNYLTYFTFIWMNFRYPRHAFHRVFTLILSILDEKYAQTHTQGQPDARETNYEGFD